MWRFDRKDDPVTLDNFWGRTEADCVAKYNALVTAANDAGLKEVEKYYSDHYKATLNAWK